MTENEAIEILKNTMEHTKVYEDDVVFTSDFVKAYEMAIKALEEIEEYKLKEFQCHLAQQEGITNGYNKAIDEFAEKLKRKILEEIYDVSDRQKNYEVGSDMSMTCSHIMGTLRDVYHRIVDEIAEQMKAGGK